MRYLKKKKADLSLSVNAIVILVLAITMLSLGLMFINNIFGGVLDKFKNVNKQMEEQLIERLKTSSERLVIEQQSFDVKKGSRTKFHYGLKNDLGDAQNFEIINKDNPNPISRSGEWDEQNSAVTCYDRGGMTDDENINIEFIGNENLRVKAGDQLIRLLEMRVSSGAQSGFYSCSMVIKNEEPGAAGSEVEYARADFTVNVE
jgi:hypothetical protein